MKWGIVGMGIKGVGAIAGMGGLRGGMDSADDDIGGSVGWNG